MERLDYLQDLGVTALYLNPLNDAPSLHKYDARNYHHIDRNFGPDPRGDERRTAAEDPADPATWTWTAADSLFLALVREIHRRGMRVIMDYSWNHTGITFWAWQDVLKNQRSSPLRRLVRDRAVRRSGDGRHQRVPLPGLGRRAVAAGVEEGGPPGRQDPRPHRGKPDPGRAEAGLRRDPPLARPERRRRSCRTASTASGWMSPRWCPWASGATTGSSCGASIRRRTWWARSGGRSGPT